jgi:ElaB/YqjD/DUF883 family membrane-anchored ribosome-binding protein
MIQEQTPASGGDSHSSGQGLPEKADELLEAARKRGRGLLNRQKRAAVEELSSVAGVMRDAATKFEEKQEEGVGDYVRKAADYVEGLSASLGERDLEELLHQAEGKVRERPALCLGLTVGVGFMLGRFLRASSQRVVKTVQSENPHVPEHKES